MGKVFPCYDIIMHFIDNSVSFVTVLMFTSFLVSMLYAMLVTLDLIDGLVQERRNSSALAMDLRLSCINPSKCKGTVMHVQQFGEEWSVKLTTGPGAPISLRFSSIVIQIWWTFNLSLILFLVIRSLHIFAHDMTAELSCHLQTCAAIGSVVFGWYQTEISSKFELRYKKNKCYWYRPQVSIQSPRPMKYLRKILANGKRWYIWQVFSNHLMPWFEWWKKHEMFHWEKLSVSHVNHDHLLMTSHRCHNCPVNNWHRILCGIVGMIWLSMWEFLMILVSYFLFLVVVVNYLIIREQSMRGDLINFSMLRRYCCLSHIDVGDFADGILIFIIFNANFHISVRILQKFIPKQ